MQIYQKTFSIFAAFLLLGGCGGSNSDSDGPKFTTLQKVNVTEGVDAFTVNATDKNGVTYSIVGGVDASQFVIDPTTGKVSFKTLPDYEKPTDADDDDHYEVVVQAIDTQGNITTQPLTIIVTDNISDNGPVFTSGNSVTLKENLPLNYTVTAKPLKGKIVTYSISGGADQQEVVINSQSGKLSFESFVPDFDFPSDANKDNHYEFTVEAKDDQDHISVQHMTIVITDDTTDLVPTRHVWKTGQDDGLVSGLPFGDDRNFTVKNNGNERVIIAGNRMWEDSPHSAETKIGFYAAQDYCNGLNYGGYDDWRVPNRHELAEMINYGKKDVLFDDIIEHKIGARYWTSQEKFSQAGGSGLGWSISFVDGGVHDKNKDDAYNVRCVRGNEIQDVHDFAVEGDTVIDNKTGIIWQNAEFTGSKTWDEAKADCKNLVFEGYDDWRLPNVNELRTIMPYDNNEILFEDLSPIGNGNLDSGHSWSSTQVNANYAYYNLNDWDAGTNRDSLIVMYEEYPKTDNEDLMLNRCIRGGHL